MPGGDIITAEYVAGEPTMIPRNPVSVAHQMGRERALLEMFGNMGWQVTPASCTPPSARRPPAVST